MKKLLSFILAITICFSVIPFSVFAIESGVNSSVNNFEGSDWEDQLSETGSINLSSLIDNILFDAILDKNGVLTISNATTIPAGFSDELPWELRNKITCIIFEENVTEISSDAFYALYNLQTVTLPESLSFIGDYAFGECTKLVEVINMSPLDIEVGSENHGCVGLYAIEVHKDESKLTEYEDFLFFASEKNTYLLNYFGEETKPVLPSSFNDQKYGIYTNAFKDNETITEVIIPEGVTSIGDGAFDGCYYLSKVEIPDSVISIGKSAFSSCMRLTSVSIPNGISSIEQDTFGYCLSLESIEIPESVTSIGSSAFYYCERSPTFRSLTA